MAASDIANVEKALTLMRGYRRGVIRAALELGSEAVGHAEVKTALEELPEIDSIIAALKSARGDEKVLEGGRSTAGNET